DAAAEAFDQAAFERNVPAHAAAVNDAVRVQADRRKRPETWVAHFHELTFPEQQPVEGPVPPILESFQQAGHNNSTISGSPSPPPAVRCDCSRGIHTRAGVAG